jgi:hypothetical protein
MEELFEQFKWTSVICVKAEYYLQLLCIPQFAPFAINSHFPLFFLY